jgi:hypothetical protein
MDQHCMMLLKCCGSWAGYCDPNHEMTPLGIDLHGEPIWLYPNDAPYLVSHQCSIWRREFLLSCVDAQDDPWQFEIDGTHRLRLRRVPLYAYRGPCPIPYVETLYRGEPRAETKEMWKI